MKKAGIWVIATVFSAIIGVLVQNINARLESIKFPIALRIPNVPVNIDWYFLFAVIIAMLIFLFMFWVVYVIDYIYPFSIMDDLFKIRNKSPFMYHAISKVVIPISSFIGEILEKITRAKNDTTNN